VESDATQWFLRIIMSEGKKQRPYRKNKAIHEEGHEKEENLVISIIEGTKDVQKQRNRSKGLELSTISHVVIPTHHKSSSKEVTFKKDEGKEGLSSLDAERFSTATSAETQFSSQTDIEEQKMKAYVEEQMRVRRGEEVEKEPSKAEPNQTYSYSAPDHLKAESKVLIPVIPLQLNPRIMEVELPMEYKLKNIEETEKAQRELREKAQQQLELKQSESHVKRLDLHGGVEDQIATKSEEKHQKATDEIVFERFKKRLKYGQ